MAALSELYGEDLALIHHLGFESGSTAASAPSLLGLLRRAGIHGGLVVDLGCGGGRWLRKLDEAGYETFGVDCSAAMLDLACREAPAAELVRGSLFEVTIPACVAVTSLGEGLNYVTDERRRRPRSLGRLFRRVARALPVGGLFLFDVVVSGPPMRYRSWSAGEDWTVLVEVTEDPGRRLLSRDIVTFRRQGANYRRHHERHLQRVFQRDEIETELRAAGFSVRASRSWGGYRLPPRRLAFRARRKA